MLASVSRTRAPGWVERTVPRVPLSTSTRASLWRQITRSPAATVRGPYCTSGPRAPACRRCARAASLSSARGSCRRAISMACLAPCSSTAAVQSSSAAWWASPQWMDGHPLVACGPAQVALRDAVVKRAKRTALLGVALSHHLRETVSAELVCYLAHPAAGLHGGELAAVADRDYLGLGGVRDREQLFG